MSESTVIDVAVAVIHNAYDEILLTRRHAHAHQGGLWEFPGGKREANESIEEALHRELLEELGVRVCVSQPMLCLEHDYGDKRVRLDVHEVLVFEGDPTPREGQPMRWVKRAALNAYDFPTANAPIVQRLISRTGQP